MIYSNIDHKMLVIDYKTFGHVDEFEVVFPISLLITIVLLGAYNAV